MATVFSFPEVLSASEPQDDMKLRDEDKRWSSGEVKTQIESALVKVIDSFKPHGVRRVTFWLREWGLAGIAIVVPLTLLGLLITVSIFAAYGIKDNAKFQTHTEDRLDTIESELRTLEASQAPAKVLKELASLDTKHLAQNLPALRKVSEQPISEVSPPPMVLQQVVVRLQHVSESTEDYWPTLLRFIQFASRGLASRAPAPGSVPAMWLDNVSVNGVNVVGPGSIVELRGGKLQNTTFTDSLIIFTTTPTKLINVRFVGCAFEFPDLDEPSPSVKDYSRELLASGIQSATITGM